MNKENSETMDNFIPKNAVKFCNQCKHRIPGDNGIQFEPKQ